jgi:hypothetical protein
MQEVELPCAVNTPQGVMPRLFSKENMKPNTNTLDAVLKRLVGGLLVMLAIGIAGPRETLAAVPGAPTVWINGQTGAAFNFTNVASVTVELRTTFAGGTIFYTLDGSAPSLASTLYTSPFQVTNTVSLRAIAYASDFTTALAEPLPIRLWLVVATVVKGAGLVIKAPDKPLYDPGEKVVLTAEPARFFRFLEWEDGVVDNPREVVVGADSTYVAVFTNTVPVEIQVTKQWDRAFGGESWDELTSVIPTRDGGCLVAGSSASGADGNKASSSFGHRDYWAVKVDAAGDKEWDRAFGGGADDVLTSVVPTRDGGYLLAGHSQLGAGGNKTSNGFGRWDYWVVKVDGTGNKEWDRACGGSQDDYLTSVVATSDGGYLLGGWSSSGAGGNKTSSSFGDRDYWVVKVDGAGNKQWDRAFGGGSVDWLTSVVVTSDGGFLLAGWSGSGAGGNKTSNTFGSRDYWVVKVDGAGNKQWDRAFGGGQDDGLTSIVATSDGGYLLGGYSISGADGNKSSNGFGGDDYWVVKLDGAGNKEWDRAFGGSSYDDLTSVLATSDGGFLLTGSSGSGAGGNKTSNGFGGVDYWVVKVDGAGNKQLDRAFGGGGSDALTSVVATSDGGYLLAGYSYSGAGGNMSTNSFGGYDYWVVKVDGAGNKAWDRAFGGGSDDLLWTVVATSDGGYLLGGGSSSGAGGNKSSIGFGRDDYWVVKINTRFAPAGAPLVLVNQDPGYEFNFTNSPTIEVSMSTTFATGRIHYTLDGSAPTTNSARYLAPFRVQRTATIRAIAYGLDGSSGEADPVRVNVWETYTLLLISTPGGSVRAEPAAASYPSNSVVSLLAVAEPGWQFVGWTGQPSGSNPTVELRMDGPKLVSPLFGTSVRTAVTGNGTIRLIPDLAVYPAGSTVQAVAIPGAGSFFGVWGGDASGNLNPLPFTISKANPTISALFAALSPGQAALTVVPNGHGRVLADPRGGVFALGTAVTLRAVPDGALGFLGWAGGYAGDPRQNPITVTMDQSKLVVASFVGADPGTLGAVAYVDRAQVGADGSFSFVLGSGVKGAVVIEVSTDLRDWVESAVVTNETGLVEVKLPAVGRRAAEFYRARQRE